MFKNLDYKSTYCEPEYGNIRYPSGVKEAYDGWAYVFTQDINYVRDLTVYHVVEVRVGKSEWIPFSGYLPTRDDVDDFNSLSADRDDNETDR